MAVAVIGSSLCPYHPMGSVPQLVDVCGNDRLRETWPPKGGLDLRLHIGDLSKIHV